MKALNCHIFLASAWTIFFISITIQTTTDKFAKINWSMKFDDIIKLEGRKPDLTSGSASAPTGAMYKNVTHLGLTGDKAYVFADKKLVLVIFGVERNNLSKARADSAAIVKALTSKYGDMLTIKEGKLSHHIWKANQSQVSLNISSDKKGVYTAMAFYSAP